MTKEQWTGVEAHFDALSELAPEERAAKLASISDEEIRREVASLLDHASEGETVPRAIGEMAARIDDSSKRDERIGPYRLIRRLARGGQGSVYEAVRDDGSFQQHVAIKIVKWDIDSDDSRRRFRDERQILAGLQHPNIARLLNGGETPDGAPYLVMEFIDGQPLNVAAEGWALKRKLELFLQIADAVAYAHRNLIVHRDLKPANILVTADGTPKLLDFGIAKLMGPEATRTRTEFVGLTPDYASPEQVRGLPISTASDVYSLGVVLYQLLTGRKPYKLDTVTPLEMDRVIVQQPAAPPGLGDELDHILLMALRKEPGRRYQSVDQFAGDIQRYLDHRPIMAQPDTVWYRSRKYLRRHWVGMAAASIALAGVLSGTGVAIYQARRAQRQFNDVRQLANRFLFDFDTEVAKVPGNVKVREMIVSTALEYLNRLAAERSGDPGLQWEVAQAFAKVAAVQGSTTQPSLRQPQDGIASYERAFSLARPLTARNALSSDQRGDLVDMFARSATLHRSLKDYEGSLRLLREAGAQTNGLPSALRTRVLGDTAITLRLMGDLSGSLDLLEKIAGERRELANRDPSFVNRRNLATALTILGEGRSALTLFEQGMAAESEALSIYRGLAEAGANDPAIPRRVFQVLVLLGDTTGAGDSPSMGRYSDAADRYEAAIAAMDTLISSDRNDQSSRGDVGQAHGRAAYSLRDTDPRRALAHARRASELLDTAAFANTEFRASPRIAAGDAHRALGEFAAADESLREADSILKVRGGDIEGDLDLAWARLEAARGQNEVAAKWFARAIAIGEQIYQKNSTPATAWVFSSALELAAAALPNSAPAFRQRVSETWSDQNRRYPNHPWIQQRLAEARSHIARH